jgi:uncharacterized protein YndB with AHSA1/START domain
MTTDIDESTTLAPVRRSITVEASQARAFDLFTAGFDTWWPRTHHLGTSEPFTGIMEPRTGGRWYERGADGVETEWGSVKAFEPPSRVVLSWHLNGAFEYQPDRGRASEVEVRFVAEGDNRTRVELEHRHFEGHGPEDGARVRSGVGAEGGWGDILAYFARMIHAA